MKILKCEHCDKEIFFPKYQDGSWVRICNSKKCAEHRHALDYAAQIVKEVQADIEAA